jgi:hypothetical protein
MKSKKAINSVVLGAILMVIMLLVAVPLISRTTAPAFSLVDDTLARTCDVDGDGLYAPEDTCPCNRPDPARGNGYVQLQVEFPENSGAPIYQIFKYEERNKMREGNFFTQRDANALIDYVAARHANALDGSKPFPEQPQFSPEVQRTFTRDYLIGASSWGTIPASAYCTSLQGDNWNLCTVELFTETWFAQEFVEGDSGETKLALECFTPDEQCKEELKNECS